MCACRGTLVHAFCINFSARKISHFCLFFHVFVSSSKSVRYRGVDRSTNAAPVRRDPGAKKKCVRLAIVGYSWLSVLVAKVSLRNRASYVRTPRHLAAGGPCSSLYPDRGAIAEEAFFGFFLLLVAITVCTYVEHLYDTSFRRWLRCWILHARLVPVIQRELYGMSSARIPHESRF